VEAPLTPVAGRSAKGAKKIVPTGSLEDVSIAEVERELSALREGMEDTVGSSMRTSVMTHVAWAPPEWLDRARKTLAGMGEAHPSRTLLLCPRPTSRFDRIDADVSLACFPLQGRHVCSEVIELHLHGARAAAPASIVAPLEVSDLPVFLRWRGRPPFGSGELEQLVHEADRMIVDSSEWGERLPAAYERFAEVFEETAASDIAWARGALWRTAIADLWPGVRRASRLAVTGPRADALLLAGWLRSRLRRDVALRVTAADRIERVAIDGETVELPRRVEPPSPSELLSAELDRFTHDRVYEDAVRAATA
jgi:hypothetical protein